MWPFFKDYENAIEKVLDKVNLSGTDNKKDSDFIQFENIPTVSGNEFLAPILNATRKGVLIEFKYQSFKKEESSLRLVAPYLLKEHKNRWYLVAKEKGQEIYKVFGLERMQTVTLVNENFRRDESFQSQKFFKYSIGITAKPNSEPELVKFECNTVLLQYLESQPIHASQKIEKTENGGVVSLTVWVTFELEQLLLGFGNELKVIEPKSLIKSLVKKHQDAINIYK